MQGVARIVGAERPSSEAKSFCVRLASDWRLARVRISPINDSKSEDTGGYGPERQSRWVAAAAASLLIYAFAAGPPASI